MPEKYRFPNEATIVKTEAMSHVCILPDCSRQYPNERSLLVQWLALMVWLTLPLLSLSKDKEGAEEKFMKLYEAYNILSDPKKRKDCDMNGAGHGQGPKVKSRSRPGGQKPRDRQNHNQRFHFDFDDEVTLDDLFAGFGPRMTNKIKKPRYKMPDMMGVASCPWAGRLVVGTL
jgi:hypothetical protein